MIPYVDIHTHIVKNTNDVFIYNCSDFHEIKSIISTCSIGIHPWNVQSKAQIDDWCELFEQTIFHKSILCIGECGLDKTKPHTFELQLYACMKQFKLAQKYHMPVIVHCVRAYYDIISLYKNVKCTFPLVFHKFSGNQHVIQALLAYPMYMSFGSEICFRSFPESYKDIPLQRIFAETDNNTQILIGEVYSCLSRVLNIDEEMLKNQIFENYKVFIQTCNS